MCSDGWPRDCSLDRRARPLWCRRKWLGRSSASNVTCRSTTSRYCRTGHSCPAPRGCRGAARSPAATRTARPPRGCGRRRRRRWRARGRGARRPTRRGPPRRGARSAAARSHPRPPAGAAAHRPARAPGPAGGIRGGAGRGGIGGRQHAPVAVAPAPAALRRAAFRAPAARRVSACARPASAPAPRRHGAVAERAQPAAPPPAPPRASVSRARGAASGGAAHRYAGARRVAPRARGLRLARRQLLRLALLPARRPSGPPQARHCP
jgi:hypothetical protein